LLPAERRRRAELPAAELPAAEPPGVERDELTDAP
jgi:hypothetical protein